MKGHVSKGHVMKGHVMKGHVIKGHVMKGHVMKVHVMKGHFCLDAEVSLKWRDQVVYIYNIKDIRVYRI